jgi:hypothetical protein
MSHNARGDRPVRGATNRREEGGRRGDRRSQVIALRGGRRWDPVGRRLSASGQFAMAPHTMLPEVVAAKDLVVAPTERDLRARYKQTNS